MLVAQDSVNNKHLIYYVRIVIWRIHIYFIRYIETENDGG